MVSKWYNGITQLNTKSTILARDECRVFLISKFKTRIRTELYLILHFAMKRRQNCLKMLTQFLEGNTLTVLGCCLYDGRCTNISLSDWLIHHNICLTNERVLLLPLYLNADQRKVKTPSNINTYSCTSGKRNLQFRKTVHHIVCPVGHKRVDHMVALPKLLTCKY